MYPGETIAADGTRSGYDVYANMYQVDLRILVVTEAKIKITSQVEKIFERVVGLHLFSMISFSGSQGSYT